MALYQEIADRIRKRVERGEYPPGERIPSIRSLAETFGCNKLTVKKAFERLIAEGLLETVVGSGTYVKYPAVIQPVGEVFDLSTDYLADTFFPADTAARIFQEIFAQDRSAAFSAAPMAGDAHLIEALGLFLPPAYQTDAGGFRGPTGARSGGQGLFRPDPGDHPVRGPDLPGSDIPVQGAPFSSRSMRTGRGLPSWRPAWPKASVCFTPCRRCTIPTGITYSASRREAVARLAARPRGIHHRRRLPFRVRARKSAALRGHRPRAHDLCQIPVTDNGSRTAAGLHGGARSAVRSVPACQIHLGHRLQRAHAEIFRPFRSLGCVSPFPGRHRRAHGCKKRKTARHFENLPEL